MQEKPSMIAVFPDDDSELVSLLFCAKTLGINGEDIKSFIINKFITDSQRKIATKDFGETLKKKAPPLVEMEKPLEEEAPSTQKPKAGRRKTETLSNLLKRQSQPIGIERFRCVLVQLGILEERWVGEGGAKSRYRCLTADGLKYGRNLKKDDAYAVRFYEDTFQEVFEKVKASL